MMQQRQSLLCTLIGFFLCSWAWAGETIVLPANFQKEILGQGVLVLEDPSDALGPEDVRSIPLKDFMVWDRNNFHLGHAQTAHWLKLPLVNQSDRSRSILLEVVNPYLYEFHFYTDYKGMVRSDTTGIRFPFVQREQLVHRPEAKHRNFQFAVSIPAGDTIACYLHFPPSRYPLNFQLYLWDEEYRSTHQRRLEDYLLNSFFLLCLVYLLILGVAIYVTKFHYYWFYFAYAFLGTFVVFSDLGLGFRYFWPDNSYLQQIILLIIVNLYLVTGTFFVRHHFDTAIYYERIDKVLKSIIGLAVLVIPFSFFMPYISIGWAHWVSRFQNLLIISTCLTFFYLLFRAITGSEIASSRLFLFGFSLHGISVIVSGMQDVGLLRGGSLPVALMEMDIPLTFYTQVSFMLGMLLEMGVIFYIAIRRFRILFQVFQEHAAKQQKNMNALVLGIEGERQRIAQDLHDGLGVMLSSAKMRLNLLKDKTDDQQLMEQELDGVIRHIDQSHQEVRQISHNLMPKSLYKLGFDAAVQEQIHRLEMLNDKIKIKLYKNISFEEARQLAQTYLFRIVQELLNNIFRHAHATEVNLQFVRLGEQLLLTAEDNGIGFDLGKSQDKGIGMKNIDYRVKALGGTLRVDSSPGKGCVVSIEIPLDSVF